MTKQEFLRELRLALQGQMAQTEINENVRYYDGYIMQEIEKGSSEEAVTGRLGNPRLIARTLIDASESFGRTGGGWNGYEQADSGRESYRDDSDGQDFRGMRSHSWYGKLALAAVVILVVLVVANVIAFLLPLLVPVVITLLIYALFFGNRR